MAGYIDIGNWVEYRGFKEFCKEPANWEDPVVRYYSISTDKDTGQKKIQEIKCGGVLTEFGEKPTNFFLLDSNHDGILDDEFLHKIDSSFPYKNKDTHNNALFEEDTCDMACGISIQTKIDVLHAHEEILKNQTPLLNPYLYYGPSKPRAIQGRP